MSVDALKKWFKSSKRDLPWREDSTPYSVWVSEVMLQQTQVSVVVPYFLRWMERFPTIEALAEANLDEVIKEWEGLGYYSRARNLHQGAKDVVENYGGILPDNLEGLRKIKGIGDYTAGAIMNFAFNKKAPAIDGNVIRVITRKFGITDDVTKRQTQKQIRDSVIDFLPESEPWVVSEALIELGATICMKKPKCGQCPLKAGCRSFLNGTMESLPNKSTKIKIEKLYRSVAVITCEDWFLLKRGDEGGLMHDLHEFPYFEVGPEGASENQLVDMISDHLNLDVIYSKTLSPQKQSFTRYQVALFPFSFHARERLEVEGYQWFPKAVLERLAFSSGHRRIYNLFSFLLAS